MGAHLKPRCGVSPREALAEPHPDPPDVDECLEQRDQCLYNQLCENTAGGHHCSCPRGYRTQGPGLPCLGTRPWPSWALAMAPGSRALVSMAEVLVTSET